MRLIEADDLKQRLLKAYAFSDNSDGNAFEKGKASAFWEVTKWLDDMAIIADDEGRFRLKGRSEWIEDSDTGQEYGTTWACIKCGHSLHNPYIWNPYERSWRYCPWCGRKMEKGDGQ